MSRRTRKLRPLAERLDFLREGLGWPGPRPATAPAWSEVRGGADPHLGVPHDLAADRGDVALEGRECLDRLVRQGHEQPRIGHDLEMAAERDRRAGTDHDVPA